MTYIFIEEIHVPYEYDNYRIIYVGSDLLKVEQLINEYKTKEETRKNKQWHSITLNIEVWENGQQIRSDQIEL